MIRLRFICTILLVALGGATARANDWDSQVTHKYADSDGVKIHYAVTGQGPLMVFIHGFPDFWYSWHNQMKALQSEYTVAALDTRGYNLSDKPEGVENYDMTLLVEDVKAVIDNENRDTAIIVGHDWGGVIAWSFAMTHPDLTDKLVIVNLPHLKGLLRELQKKSQQHINSAYARRFQQPNSHERLDPQGLATMVSRGNAELREKYGKAFENSSLDAMMNYYRQNYPREPYDEYPAEFSPVKMPVLQFHGLNDSALLPGALNNTWEWLEKDWTLVTIPDVGHWSHHEKPELVSETIRWWLRIRQ